MGLRAGAAMRELCKEHSLPEPTVFLSSPLRRCVETAVAAAQGAGFEGKIAVEPALCESICEDWYRSWAVPGADGRWGGPAADSEVAAGRTSLAVQGEVETADLHPAALLPVGQLFLTVDELEAVAAAGGGAIDQSYSATLAVDGLKYCWKRYEAECGVDANTGLRIGGFCAEFSRAHPSVTFVVCTHGGPSASCFEYLTGCELVQSVGYTAIHILIKDQESTLAGTSGRWRALVTGSTRHLND